MPYIGFGNGVRVGVGDVDGDGLCDILTGVGPGAGPHAKAFSGGTFAEIQSYFAYDASFDGGIFLTAGGPLPTSIARSSADAPDQATAQSVLMSTRSETNWMPAAPGEADVFSLPDRPMPPFPATVDRVFAGEPFSPVNDLVEAIPPGELDFGQPEWFDRLP